MSKNISLSWSLGVTDQESALATATVGQVLAHVFMQYPDMLTEPPMRVHAYGNWVIPALAPNKPYWGTQWYVDSSYDRQLSRVIAPTFLELVRQEPWQRSDPHYDLAILDQDLTDFPAPLARLRPDRYTLGTSFPGTSAVLSVHRLRTLTDDHTRRLSLMRLVRHHLGHMLGVPMFTRSKAVSRLGLELHCTNTCSMRHAGSTEQLAEYAIEESEMGWAFCPDCTRELVSVAYRHWRNWN